jgi:hypothetical protein
MYYGDIVLGFLLIFSIVSLVKLGFNFLSAFFSNPPKEFELTNTENLIYGLFVTYILTYIIYI